MVSTERANSTSFSDFVRSPYLVDIKIIKYSAVPSHRGKGSKSLRPITYSVANSTFEMLLLHEVAWYLVRMLFLL